MEYFKAHKSYAVRFSVVFKCLDHWEDMHKSYSNTKWIHYEICIYHKNFPCYLWGNWHYNNIMLNSSTEIVKLSKDY